MTDHGFIYNARIFRVKINNSSVTFSFFVRQIRKEKHDVFDGEIWGTHITGQYKGESNQDVYSQIEQAINAQYASGFTISPENQD